MNTPQAAPGDNSKIAAVCLAVVTIFVVMAFYGWYSGGWERGYQRERLQQQQRGRETLEGLERAYQVSPEKHQQALDDAYGDAPVGRTRGGDTY